MDGGILQKRHPRASGGKPLLQDSLQLGSLALLPWKLALEQRKKRRMLGGGQVDECRTNGWEPSDMR